MIHATCLLSSTNTGECHHYFFFLVTYVELVRVSYETSMFIFTTTFFIMFQFTLKHLLINKSFAIEC